MSCLACAYVTKRPVFLFISREFRPSNLIQVFGFADDYSFGVLQSHAHWLWFITKCGKLKSDFRYSAESVFDTFPWPQFTNAATPAGAPEAQIPGRVGVPPAGFGVPRKPSNVGNAPAANDASATHDVPRGTPGTAGGTPTLPKTTVTAADIARIEAVAAAGREVRRIRAEALPKMKGGLRALYRTLELPGANPLKAAHAAPMPPSSPPTALPPKPTSSPNSSPSTAPSPPSLPTANP